MSGFCLATNNNLSMKTLILTSSGQFITKQNIDAFLPKKIQECKIASIITASKKVDDTSYLDRHRKQMDERNFSYTEMDIDGKDEKGVREMLEGYDIVYVEGGNSFYLLKAVRESGFETVIKELIANGVVYIGSSAGSYIACPSIVISTWSKHPKDRCGVTDFTAMHLVPFFIKAHYTPDMLPELKEIRKELPAPLWVLRDDQALVVRNGKVQRIGEGDTMLL